MSDKAMIKWAFMDREAEVFMLGEKVAYSWTCYSADGDNDQGLPPYGHEHSIECLWVWHDCDLNLRPVDPHWTSTYVGWTPAGVGAHDFISAEPLHIEPSVYWPACCGMHGFI